MDSENNKKPESILLEEQELEQAWADMRNDEQFQASNDPVYEPQESGQ
ncbi:hypothetical protein [Parendozoicomonas sp. Alg238-R29]|nr:hypothetical protein [Parendozoicomonas sp. Alg238-R29]